MIHTPAPWELTATWRDSPAVASVLCVSSGLPDEAKAPEMLCMLMWPCHAQNPEAEQAAVEKTYANMNLIRAAPELYDLVFEMRKAFRGPQPPNVVRLLDRAMWLQRYIAGEFTTTPPR